MTRGAGQAPQVAAIIVTYLPDAATLRRLIDVLIDDSVFTIIVDNGGGESAIAESLPSALIEICAMHGNQGIGAAINAGCAAARAAGAKYLITFDQDSHPQPGMVGTLAEEFALQSAAGNRVAAVGPCFVDRRHSPPLVHPFVQLRAGMSAHHYCRSAADVLRTDILITSGCLMSLAVLDEVGGMDASFFVDFTDVEWCFRAQRRGFQLMGVCRAQMDHELGHGEGRRFLTLTLFDYSPIRRYYYSRNAIRVSRLAYVPLRWKLRLIAVLAVRCATLPWAPRDSAKRFWREALLSLKGIWDGLRGVHGPLI